MMGSPGDYSAGTLSFGPPQLAASLIVELVTGAMSAVGTKRTCQLRLSMSGYRGEADSVRTCRNFCIGPE